MKTLCVFFILTICGCMCQDFNNPKKYNYASRDVKCLVCRSTVEEMEKELSKISSTKKVNVGGYRMDDDGNMKQKVVPLAKSELHLSEMLDNICEKMENYVKGVYKSSGVLTVFPLLTDDNKMNTVMSEVDLIQDSDLNKSLKFYCQGLVEEFEDDFVRVFRDETENRDVKICADATKLCDMEEEDDAENVEKEEL